MARAVAVFEDKIGKIFLFYESDKKALTRESFLFVLFFNSYKLVYVLFNRFIDLMQK